MCCINASFHFRSLRAQASRGHCLNTHFPFFRSLCWGSQVASVSILALSTLRKATQERINGADLALW